MVAVMLLSGLGNGELSGPSCVLHTPAHLGRTAGDGKEASRPTSFVQQPSELPASRPGPSVLERAGCGRSTRRGRAHHLAATVALILLASGHSKAVAAPLPPSFDSTQAVEYQVVDQDLRQLLVEFGRAHGVVVALTDGVQGRLRGRLPPLPPREFLDTICRMHGLAWFYDGRHLHISALTETRSLLIPLNNVDGGRLTRMMRELGLEDARFRVRLVGDGTHVAVSGPPGFVEQIEKLVTLLSKEGATEVRVIRGRRGQEGPS